jgi:hypothetical protein
MQLQAAVAAKSLHQAAVAKLHQAAIHALVLVFLAS